MATPKPADNPGPRGRRKVEAVTPPPAPPTEAAPGVDPLDAETASAAGRWAADDDEARSLAAEAAEQAPAELPDPDNLLGPRECPLCDGAGVIPYGLRASPRYNRCPDCGGIGDVLTGSLNVEAAVATCERCSGRGYVPTDAEPAPVTALAAAPGPPVNPPWPGAVWIDSPDGGYWGIAPAASA